MILRRAKTALPALPVLMFLALACSSDPGHGGRSSQEWIRSLGDSSVATRVTAADALGRILRIQPKSPDVVRALIRALGDTDDQVRRAAASALTAEGVRAEGAITGLHEALHDSAHAEMRYAAALVLGRLGSSAGRGTVEALAESIEDPDPRVRAAAMEALGKMGLESAPTVDAVQARTRDADPEVRLKAFETLLRIRDPDTAAVNVLRTGLSDSVSSVRSGVAHLLAGLRERAAPATPELIERLGDPEPSVRLAAALALGTIGQAACGALSALRAARNDSDPRVREQVRVAIARIDPETNQ